MNMVKSISDELTMAQSPVQENDLVISVLNGLSSEFKEICTVIRARDMAITIEELYDKLVDFEDGQSQTESKEAGSMTANNSTKSKSNNFTRGRGDRTEVRIITGIILTAIEIIMGIIKVLVSCVGVKGTVLVIADSTKFFRRNLWRIM